MAKSKLVSKPVAMGSPLESHCRTMRVAVITGSSSGIGRSTAIAFASQGYAVVVHAKSNLSGMNEVARQIRMQGGEVLCVAADISDQQACHSLVQAALSWRGQVDVWVNTAGADILTTEFRNWNFEKKLQLLWEVDVCGTILLSRQIGQYMIRQTGDVKPSIINIGWDQVTFGMEGESGQLFCATKSAVMSFTLSLAQSLAPCVRVNCVAPGWIQTAWGNIAEDKWDARARRESLLNRWGTPDEVAQTICWLASEGAAFINGQIIPVNGGRRHGGPQHAHD